MTTKSDLWDLTEPYLAAERLELDDLEVKGSGKSRTIKVVVDGEGLDLDRLSEISRGISRLFDAETDLDSPYQLEVTSPGLERALTRPAQFKKSVGREVTVKGRDEAGTVDTHRGVLSGADDSAVTVTVDDRDYRYPYDAVISARTVFRWEATPKPGK